MKYELPSTKLIVIEENNYLKFGEYLNDMQCDDTTNKLCLDDLEYVKKLQQENKRLNGAIQTYDILLKSNVEGNRKQQEMIDKIFSRITLWKMEDITKETAKILDELLEILSEVSE